MKFQSLKASLEFNNIDLKAELKRSGRQLDIKVLNAIAQVRIVLSQTKNNLFNMEFTLDQESDLYINIKPDPEIGHTLNEHMKSLLTEAAKQTFLNLEMNFMSKKCTPTSRSAVRAYLRTFIQNT